jgi:serine/threonine-protein kinase ATR
LLLANKLTFTDVLLNYVEGMSKTTHPNLSLLSFAAEASWATGRWDILKKYTAMTPLDSGDDFNVNIGRALVALNNKEMNLFETSIELLRKQIARSLSRSTTSSLGACHDNMLKLHVLTELEMIATTDNEGGMPRQKVLESLDRRLEVIGAYLNDKQYLLGIRRAAMKLSRYVEGFNTLI